MNPTEEAKPSEKQVSPKSNHPSLPSSKKSRRRFLALIGAGAATIGLKTLNPLASQDQDRFELKAEDTPPKLSPLEQLMYKNFTPEEIKSAKTELENRVNLLRNQPGYKDRVKKTKEWKNLVERIVSNPKSGIKPEDRQKYIDLTLATIFVESSGFENLETGQTDYTKLSPIDNPDENKDQGLTQLKRKVVSQRAKELGLPDNFRLKDPETNIKLFLENQKWLEQRFGSLSPVMHNWGYGNGSDAIYAYETEVLGKDTPLVIKAFRNEGGLFATREYIEKDQINMLTLINSNQVRLNLPRLREENFDYFWHLLSADQVLRS